MRIIVAIGLGFLAPLVWRLPDASAQTYKFKTLDYRKDGTILYGINTSGVVVGDYAYDYDTQEQCFSVIKGKKTVISDPEGVFTSCYDINNSGQIVGTYENEQSVMTGFIYDGSSFKDVTVPGSTESFALGMSDNGIVIGTYYPSNGEDQMGFLYNTQNSTFSSFAVIASIATSGVSINDSGVYTIQTMDNFFKPHSYISDGTRYKEVKFPKAVTTYVRHINNAGQVAATWVDKAGNSHGGIYDSVAKTYTTIDDPGMAETFGEGISDNQSLAGTFMATASSANHGYTAKVSKVSARTPR